MKIAFRIVLLAGIAALGCWLWTALFPSPEKQVLKKISRLAATVTFSGDVSNIVRAGKVSSLLSYFSTDAQIVVDVTGFGQGTLNGRDEIREAAAGGFTRLKSLDVKFLDATPKVSADKLSAVVNCTAELHVADSKDFGVQELKFQLKKLDGDWRITRVETVKTLQ
jgi:hypothetical protein